MTAKRAACGAVVMGIALSAFGLAACEGDDTNPAHVGGASSSSGGLDATVEGGTVDDGGTATAAFCATYGGYPNVQKMADDIIAAAAADCRISAEFSAIGAQKLAHVSQCFEKQLGTIFGCPGVVYDKDNANQPCRSMTTAHQDLGLRKADFDAFVSLGSGVLQKAGLSDGDRQIVVSGFIQVQQQVAPRAGTGNANCSCPNLVVPGTTTYCGLPDAGIKDAGDGGLDGDTGTIADAADEG